MTQWLCSSIEHMRDNTSEHYLIGKCWQKDHDQILKFISHQESRVSILNQQNRFHPQSEGTKDLSCCFFNHLSNVKNSRDVSKHVITTFFP